MVPSICMPIIASGCASGVVVDIGERETIVAAFLYGQMLVGTVRSQFNLVHFPSAVIIAYSFIFIAFVQVL